MQVHVILERNWQETWILSSVSPLLGSIQIFLSENGKIHRMNCVSNLTKVFKAIDTNQYYRHTPHVLTIYLNTETRTIVLLRCNTVKTPLTWALKNIISYQSQSLHAFARKWFDSIVINCTFETFDDNIRN